MLDLINKFDLFPYQSLVNKWFVISNGLPSCRDSGFRRDRLISYDIKHLGVSLGPCKKQLLAYVPCNLECDASMVWCCLCILRARLTMPRVVKES